MSHEVLLAKLDTLARCLDRLQAKTPASLEELQRDVDLQDILMLNLERLVQASVDIATHLIAEKGWTPVPSTMAGTFDVLFQQGAIEVSLRDRLKKSVGFRNIAVHEYEKINWAIVRKILTDHLKDFREFGRIVEALK
jgi:uncharacterized protein YutE (UPF0331/DUF86 family)